MSLHFLVRSNPLQRVNRLKRVTTSGFTLMEMLIVVAIMLLLVIATLPRIKYALDESKVRESSRQLNSYFAMAKSRAASTGRSCGLYMQVEALPTGGAQCTQLYLAETPPAYSGDVLEDQVFVGASSNSPAVFDSGPDYDENYRGTWWQINLPNSFATLNYLLADEAPPYPKFKMQFDYKGPYFNGIQYNGNYYVIGPKFPDSPSTPIANRILPPGAGAAPPVSRKYQIVRRPRRIGAPLALPRGTSVDLNFSGMGANGLSFNGTLQSIYVMFSPTGYVESVAIDGTRYDAQGTLHFLVGRPEKVLVYNANAPCAPGTNIVDNNALWVSVGRLTGSVVTTDNAPDLNQPLTSPNQTLAEVQNFVYIAREFAITQDVRGGQ